MVEEERWSWCQVERDGNVIVGAQSKRKGRPADFQLPVVMHTPEPDLMAPTKAFPDLVLGDNQVGEALACLCGAHEGGGVEEGEVGENVG